MTRSIADLRLRGIRSLRPWRLSALACAFVAPPALAERWQVEPSVRSQFTWTDNSELITDGREDSILEIRPQLFIRGEGSRLRVQGRLGLDGVAYARHTQDSRVLPQVDVSAWTEVVERLVFAEAGYRVAQTSANPFGVRPEAGTTTNTVTTREARFSPFVEGGVSRGITYRLRADNSWLRHDRKQLVGGDADGYFGRYSASLAQRPEPLGWRLESERSYTRYDDAAQPSVGLNQLRAVVSYALDEEWLVGIRGGREGENLRGAVQTHPTHGVEVKWTPSARTTLSASADKRFFGTGWALTFNHRMPMLAWNADMARTLDTTPQSLFELPPTDNVAGLLDAMFTTRYPDPAERARVVRDAIDRNGLPASTTGAISLLSDRLSLVTRRRIGLIFNGVRNSIAVSVYHVRTQDAIESTGLSTNSSIGNNVQRGASVTLNHRLSPSLALNASVDRSRIRSLEGFGNDQTSQRTARLQANLQLAPRTNSFVGIRHRKIESNTSTEGNENAFFAGVDHRF